MGIFGKRHVTVDSEMAARYQRLLEETEKRQSEYGEYVRRSQELQDRFEKLLQTWESQTQRIDALLTKREKND